MDSLSSRTVPFDGPCIKMDVEESAGGYLVQAELPGLAKGDIDVEVDGNVVSISAELKHGDVAHDGQLLRSERFYGARRRTFTMPHAIDAARTSALYADGVLSLTLPILADATHRRITVH